MLDEFLDVLELHGVAARRDGDELVFGERRIPIREGVPRFTPDASYSTGNFSRLREQHATLQLDSRNGTTDRLDTLLGRTGWPADFWRGKRVLECGCGAGPDTEILLSLGARVLAVDIAGLDVARRNLGERPELCQMQASIADLPLREASFDVVFCHRVLQHTPDPAGVLRHMLRFVKPDGAVFVHSYARTAHQMLRWKYALRPLTRRMDSERLYRLIEWYAPYAYRLGEKLLALPRGAWLGWVFVPFLNYRHEPKFRDLSDAQILEYGVHDTFDALSPRYDAPLGARRMREIAAERLQRPFEIAEAPTVTLLRSVLPET
jgi:SAM-dependent methyltransferase